MAVLVPGFPSYGVVGPIAVGYLVEALRMERIGSLASRTLIPAVRVEGGRAAPLTRIFWSGAHRGPEERVNQLLVLPSDIPTATNRLTVLAETLVRWAVGREVSEIVNLDAVPAEAVSPDEARVAGMANEAGGPLIDRLGLVPVTGVASGFSAALLLAAFHTPPPIPWRGAAPVRRGRVRAQREGSGR
ncbi:MAG TPA: PAC2 family protein [Thermoplasmata archaeon]|nr:PAC2 family protein [Thermoplasmata archaeon]